MAKKKATTLKIKWVRSFIGCPRGMRQTIRGLGFRRMQQVVERPDTPAIRGMIGKVRVGRGMGSKLGKTAGKGNKGQKSRKGYSRRPGFEGGQMPLHRRIPKRGFHNPFAREFAVVNVESLNAFAAGETVTPESLATRGLIHRERADE